MISLKRSIDDFDSVRARLDACEATLLSAVDAIGRHAVEVDASSVQQLRTTLKSIAEQVRSQPGRTEGVRDELDGALQDFGDRLTTYIAKIRSDLTETSESLTALLATFQRDDTDVEKRLTTEITHLRALQNVASLEVIRDGLKRSTLRLGECAEQVRREKDSVIAQLKSEIQTLQVSLDHAKRSETLDVLTHVYKRDEFVRLLRREIVRGSDIAVIHIRILKFFQLSSLYPPPVVEELVSAFSKRVENAAPPDSILGRWANDVFCVAVASPLLRPGSLALGKSCVGNYVCTQDGMARNIDVSATITCLSRQRDDELDDLLKRFDQIYPL